MIAEDVLGREERHQLDFQIPGWKGANPSVPVGEAYTESQRHLAGERFA